MSGVTYYKQNKQHQIINYDTRQILRVVFIVEALMMQKYRGVLSQLNSIPYQLFHNRIYL